MKKSGNVLICAKNVIAGKEMELKENWAVLVEDGVIAKMGPAGELKQQVPEDMIVTYDQETLVPGFFDCHDHISWDTNMEDYLNQLVNLDAVECAARSTNYMKKDLNSGVTTGRCICAGFLIDVTNKRLVQEGVLEGPDILAGGIGIRSTTGHGRIGKPFNGVQEVRQAVRDNLVLGTDVVKLFTTGGSLRTDTWTRLPSYYTKDEIFAAIDEAHRFGKPITTHCLGGQAMDWCIEGGMDSLEHAYFIQPYQIEAAMKADVTLTLTSNEYWFTQPGRPGEMNNKFSQYLPEVRECMRSVIKSGIKYTFGTDGVHGGIYVEACLAVEQYGASTRDALKALTINAAQVCELEDKKGSLEVGKQADMVVLEGNPLDDIRFVKNVKNTYKAGVGYRYPELDMTVPELVVLGE